jgi:O-antigen ligase
LTNQLFGYGYAGSIRLSGSHFAHNDWIELLASLGFFGVLIYILLFIFAFRAITSINNAGRDRWLWLTIISSWFLITIFSMWYSSLYYAPTSIILAFILGRNHVFSHKRMKSHK